MINWTSVGKRLPDKDPYGPSVCCLVSPGDYMASYPVKAWFDGERFWTVNGDVAEVLFWALHPPHPIRK